MVPLTVSNSRPSIRGPFWSWRVGLLDNLLKRLLEMVRRETLYRGYMIRVEVRGLHLHISVEPTRPDLPILFRRSFTAQLSTWNDAMTEAEHRIDQVLYS